MRLKEIAEKLGLEFVVAAETEVEVLGGHISDLLSDVLAHAEWGALAHPSAAPQCGGCEETSGAERSGVRAGDPAWTGSGSEGP